MSHIIHNARIIRDGHTIESGWLHYDDHTILAIGQGDAPQDIQADHIDADGHTLMAGFIDVHVHGGASVDTMDADPTALHTMAKFFAQNGVTGFLATTWTDSRERVYAAMRAVKDAQQTSWHDGATLLGVHMEGPYLNIERAGAQNPDHIRRAAEDEMQLLFDLDVIKLLSLAPEFEENHWLIDACAKRGIITSIAHSSATYDQALAAFERGMSHSTHTYNAMTPLHHRKPGIVGAVMQSPHVMAELIADNIHVHPAAMNTLYRIK
ncbi:MAG: N-acetylglucosamine-6-phosphate deacetylase, partial [Aggregatilineales bacterium]